jgi:hypothetical protein
MIKNFQLTFQNISVNKFFLAKVVALIFGIKIVSVAPTSSIAKFLTGSFLMVEEKSLHLSSTFSHFWRKLANFLYIFERFSKKF